MAKKSFVSGLDEIIGGVEIQESFRTPEDRSKEKTRRATFVIDIARHEDLKAFAWWKRKQIKEVLQEALELYFSSLPEREMEKAQKVYKQQRKR